MSWMSINFFVMACAVVYWMYFQQDKLIKIENRIIKALKSKMRGQYKTIYETDDYIIVQEIKK